MYHQQSEKTSIQQPIPQFDYSKQHPKSFDPKIKTQLINQNIYQSSYGNYKVCPTGSSVKLPYKKSYSPGPITSICKVLVQHKHSLDVADTLCDHGLNSLTVAKPIPAIVYPMGNDFIGTNTESREGVSDETLMLRSNYPYVIKKQPEFFSSKDKQIGVVYSNPITVFRDSNFGYLHYDNLFRVGVITMCYTKQNELTKRSSKDKNTSNVMLTSNDLLMFQMCVENAIQAAICGYHDILILPLIGDDQQIPIDDQILVYNMCIMKFSHMFKAIIICVPKYENNVVFEYMDKHIIKPQEITKHIDSDFASDLMTKRLKNPNSHDPNEGLKERLANMTDAERIKELRKVVKYNLESNKK